MFKDIIIVDDIFDNPDSILEYALKQEYYSSEDSTQNLPRNDPKYQELRLGQRTET